MAFKSILVQVDDSERCALRLGVATRLAQEQQARLIGIYLVSSVELTPSIAALLPSDVVEARQRETGEAQHAAERQFREAARTAGLAHVEWRAPAGPPLAAAIAHGRCADLFVMGQREPDDPALPFSEELITTALLSTGRPLLVVPYIGAAPTLGKNVLVAWDGGRESSRAIADALPLLERAAKVNVVAIDSREDQGGEHALAGARLAGWLRDHAIEARIDRLVAAENGVGETLLSRAADLGSDLIVMGGYGHTRLRELVLGGATRAILGAMTVPVLMSH